MSGILELWQGMQDSDKEHALFDSYVNSRKEYLSEIRSHAKGEVSNMRIPELYAAEREAFAAYLAHRTETKPKT